MPFLLVNLDDVGDMQRSMRQLRRRLRRQGHEGGKRGCGGPMAQEAGARGQDSVETEVDARQAAGSLAISRRDRASG